MQPHGLIRTVAAATALVLLLAGPAGAQNAAPVEVATAEQRTILNLVRVSGTVVAPRTSQVSTSLGGLVEEVAVDLGVQVAAGDTLVALDDALARHDVARAAAAVDEAEADLADARQRVRRAEQLAQTNNIPQSELDSRRAEAQRAAASVDRLEAEASAARERLDQHTITAPFEGVVTDRVTEPGEWVSPGETLVVVSAVDQLYVDLQVPQTYYPDLRDGAPISLSFEALPGRSVPAVIAAQVPVSDPTQRTFTLRVAPDAEGTLPLTPGMSARAEIELATGTQDIVVPRGAIIRYPDGRTTVWTLDDSEERLHAREVQVELGRAFSGVVQVTSGLEVGQRVVTRGNETLRPGQAVRLSGSDS
ncbi:efflux RND transporter periplasmic adaptor subunit [Rhodovibrio salinarum]|uniref:HlyD family secretion protein n=1 Tax=Rhodovibrio salinarum TaxID=1087 RepID=A0A934QJL9_9PROT|nr:efflux RND transporter periplasmic adaptor subunit [Rhodovibrio salinarum]MBK1698318.1 HlyD family secretion protein [Rhodovibrio salinarum]